MQGKRRWTGKDGRGRDLDEHAIRLNDPETGDTFTARRITLALDKPNKDGETELHILTNLPRKAADAVRTADLYADRWTIETGFQHLTDDLRCEIDTLPAKKFAATLVDLARHLDPRKDVQHPRGPKRKQPKKIRGKTNHHVSTARILAMRQ